MPYKSEKIKIEKTSHDRRMKLTEEQKDKIRAEVGKSQRKLAEEYGVSRRTIQFILSPEKLLENKKRRLERGGWKQYYNKDKYSQEMKEHRRYKQELYLKGEIK